ncbi:MAG: sulfurtransferase [Gammaproteobacteria bacterium]|nr:sulfurtransferase [Gammaproteobacteria bacterium]
MLLPRLVEAEILEKELENPNLLIIDLCRNEYYQKHHIPGAIHLEYGAIVRNAPPVGGLLPTEADLSKLFSAIGLTPELHVVAYDDEGGGKAARLIWTLACIGHHNASMLNGGLFAWGNEGHPTSDRPQQPTPSTYTANISSDAMAHINADEVVAALNSESALLDARSEGEYLGTKKFAERAGRIPGAIHMEWTKMMDQPNNMRLKPLESVRGMLQEHGIKDGQEVIAYCQTHHRSALSWFVLDLLGYRARGYEGSWSDWGNRSDTPIEI